MEWENEFQSKPEESELKNNTRLVGCLDILPHKIDYKVAQYWKWVLLFEDWINKILGST